MYSIKVLNNSTSRMWRNRQTRTFQVRMPQGVWVQVPPSADHNELIISSFFYCAKKHISSKNGKRAACHLFRQAARFHFDSLRKMKVFSERMQYRTHSLTLSRERFQVMMALNTTIAAIFSAGCGINVNAPNKTAMQ